MSPRTLRSFALRTIVLVALFDAPHGHLSDRAGHWHPHLMFFYSKTDPASWAAGAQGSPIFAFDDKWEDLTVFLIPVREWSDGTADHS